MPLGPDPGVMPLANSVTTPTVVMRAMRAGLH
jgi:hypothetical protein